MITLTQEPGQAILVELGVGFERFSDPGMGVEYVFRINEETITDFTNIDTCPDVEFNPLAEFNYDGSPNEFQDPSRGRIGAFAAFDENVALESDVLLQNLIGEDGIIGRSITLISVHSTDPDAITELNISCCNIGRVNNEEVEAPAEVPVENPHHHGGWHQPQPHGGW